MGLEFLFLVDADINKKPDMSINLIVLICQY